MLLLLAAAAALPVIDMTQGRKCKYGMGNEVVIDPHSGWDGTPLRKYRVHWCRPKPVFEGGAWRIGAPPNPWSPYWTTHRPERD